MLHSADGVPQFHELGFTLFKGLLSQDELGALQEASRGVIDEAMQGQGEGHWRTDVDRPETYFRSERMLERGNAFLMAAMNPELLRQVGRCLGAPFMLLNDALITKLPASVVKVRWHQDPPYQGQSGRPFTSDHANFVVDIYLDPSTPESGCIYVLPGRHLSGRVPLEGYGEERLFAREDAVSIVADPGDVGFHALSAPHGSAENKTERPRRILLFHYVTRQIYDGDYKDWMHNYGGYSDRALALLRRGEAFRKELYPHEDRKLLHIGDDGIHYLGNDAFAPNHWRTMIASLSATEHDGRRALD